MASSPKAKRGYLVYGRPIRQGFCTKPDVHVAPNEGEIWLLLAMLTRDLPSHELCHFCRILHRLPNAEPPCTPASLNSAQKNTSHGFQVYRHDRSYLVGNVDGILGCHWMTISHYRTPVWKKALRWYKRRTTWIWGRDNESQRTCPYCPTTARSKTYRHKQQGLEAVLNVWQNLGRRQSPDDTEWWLCRRAPCTIRGQHACGLASAGASWDIQE